MLRSHARTVIFLLVLVLGAPAAPGAQAVPNANLYEQAEEAATRPDVGKARDLFKQAAALDPDPIRRDRASIRAANLEWYVFQDSDAARALFDRVGDQSPERSSAWSERARMEVELTADYAAAVTSAGRALQHAGTLSERELALIRRATALLEPARLARVKGTCPQDAGLIEKAAADLRRAIDAGGPVLETSRLLLLAGLMTADASTITQAWHWYYADIPSARPTSVSDRRSLAIALAGARLFPEADLVLRDPCATDRPQPDTTTRDIIAYAETLRRLDTAIDQHFRSVAKGANDDADFQRKVTAESQALWKALSWPGPAPDYSMQLFQSEVDRRFGTVTSLGRTDGILTLLFGHKVIDAQRVVEQYGQSAPLRFIALDGMLSAGYSAWITNGQRGTGGWIGTDAIYQIRPMYADGPTRQWRQTDVPDVRARTDRDITDETRRDVERVAAAPITYLRGLDLRLRRQAQDALRAKLTASGLTGDALRQAFLEEAARNTFEASIWAHEGRHAIDKIVFKINDTPELEFRAKMSEVAFAPDPRGALGSILSPVGPPTAHGTANARLLKGVVAWMQANAKDIAGLDAQSALLPQLDKLTNEQLRAAFRSMDPLVNRKTQSIN